MPHSRSTRGLTWSLGWTVTVVVVLTGRLGAAEPDLASEIEALREQVRDEQARLLAARGRLKGLDRLAAALGGGGTEGGNGPAGVAFPGAAELGAALQAELRSSERDRAEGLAALARTARAQRDEAQRVWRAIAASRELPTPPPPPEPWWRKAPWVASLVLGALTVLLAVIVRNHENRRELRALRLARGARAALVAGLLSAGVGLVQTGCDSAVPPTGAADSAYTRDDKARLLTELRALKQNALAAESEAQAKRNEVLAQAREVTRARFRQALAPIALPTSVWADLDKLDALAATQLVEILEAAGQADLFVTQANALIDEARSDLGGHQSERAARRAWAWMTNALGASSAFLCGLGACLIVFSEKKRRTSTQERIERQCPRCLNLGIVEEPIEVLDMDGNKVHEAVCPSCTYRFPSSYKKFARLCLPTLGRVSSGKTHWLMSVYQKINNGNLLLPDLVLEKLPTAYDEAFDEWVVRMEEHGDVQSTNLEPPSPLIFYHRDQDPLGAREVLLNFFDYNGELALMHLTADAGLGEMKRHAMLSDSFVFFLDPTKVSPSEVNYQKNAYQKFKNDVRLVRRLSPGQKIDLTIAVCISKLDIVGRDNPMGAEYAELWLNDLRQRAHEPPTLELIEYRSQTCVAMLSVMFPGWNIEKLLRDDFGPRFKFFPLTPFGIDDPLETDDDSRARTRNPFGVVEPLYWLLHMHGYHVFKDRPK